MWKDYSFFPFWLARKEKRKVALFPIIEGNDLTFQIVGDGYLPWPHEFDPEKGTVSQAVATCPFCGAIIGDETTRHLFESGQSGQRMAAVILTPLGNFRGKSYRTSNLSDASGGEQGEEAAGWLPGRARAGAGRGGKGRGAGKVVGINSPRSIKEKFMLRKIYIDNYKSLVNFELKVGNIHLLLGPNGAGKSSVFEVLRKLRSFISGESKLDVLFESHSCTRWQTLRIQTFELEIAGEQGLYQYQLAIEHDESAQRARVKHERLNIDGNPLLSFEQGEMHLYRDDYSAGPVYPFDWTLSAVSSIFPRSDNKKLTWFKDHVQQMVVVQIVPALMRPDSDQEDPLPGEHLENFVSWYRYLSQDQGMALIVTDVLREILPGFDYFSFEAFGEKNRRLKAYFSAPGLKKGIGYSFEELSDGQRTLMGLYILLEASKKYGYILCLDEPENFLALPEIQPWLIDLYDQCQEEEDKTQALIISHHPEMINYLLASPVGFWLDRDENLVTRVRSITAQSDGGLPVSELIARGWLNA